MPERRAKTVAEWIRVLGSQSFLWLAMLKVNIFLVYDINLRGKIARAIFKSKFEFCESEKISVPQNE